MATTEENKRMTSFLQLALDQIDVRPDRQRSKIVLDDLLPSIRLRGVIQPIIVERTGTTNDRYVLIAGERRLAASRELGLHTIPARIFGELPKIEREIYELDENVRRKDLSWEDQVRAVKRIFTLYKEMDPSLTQKKIAELIGFSEATVSMYLDVANELDKGNKDIAKAGNYRVAHNMVKRRDSRVLGDMMTELLGGTNGNGSIDPDNRGSDSTGTGDSSLSGTVCTGSSKQDIINTDFHSFASTYTGLPFNFIHCDFPYGINHDKSQQGGSATNVSRPQQIHGSYEDSIDTYWALCDILIANLDRLLAQSGHMMFWLPTDIDRQWQTLNYFGAHGPDDLDFQTVPLIWHKTDNRGILPDPKRGPRRVYESALIATRGDRFIVKPISNLFGAPTTKEIHQSEKPEEMLKHFFQMFVDENTRLLDPTCGSGSALRAAEALGAKEVLGLEINEDYANRAMNALTMSRAMRKMEDDR